MKQKIIPHNIDAEISIIGGLILDSEAWDHISDILVEEDFYVPDHRTYFRCIVSLNKKMIL